MSLGGYTFRSVASTNLVSMRSLLPVPFHPSVAELCIKHQKHLVTASYISPAMKALHERSAVFDTRVLLTNISLELNQQMCCFSTKLDLTLA